MSRDVAINEEQLRASISFCKEILKQSCGVDFMKTTMRVFLREDSGCLDSDIIDFQMMLSRSLSRNDIEQAVTQWIQEKTPDFEDQYKFMQQRRSVFEEQQTQKARLKELEEYKKQALSVQSMLAKNHEELSNEVDLLSKTWSEKTGERAPSNRHYSLRVWSNPVLSIGGTREHGAQRSRSDSAIINIR